MKTFEGGIVQPGREGWGDSGLDACRTQLSTDAVASLPQPLKAPISAHEEGDIGRPAGVDEQRAAPEQARCSASSRNAVVCLCPKDLAKAEGSSRTGVGLTLPSAPECRP